MTPTQAAAERRHMEFRRKIAAGAVEDTGISCSSSVRGVIPWQSRPQPVQPSVPRTPGDVKKSVIDELYMLARPGIRIESVQAAVERYYEVSHDDLISDAQTAEISRVRQIAMFLAKHLTGFPPFSIGRKFGDRDHNTTQYAITKIKGLIGREPELAADIIAIARRVCLGRSM